jgi:beta-glucosidase
MPIYHCIGQNIKNSKADIEQRIDSLIGKMTLVEKAGQMTQIGIPAVCVQAGYWDAPDTLIIDTLKLRKALAEDGVGSFVGKGFYPPSKEEYARLIGQIQDYAVNHTRMGIPIMYATDAVHGVHYTAGSTLFPHEIAMAATWNPSLVEKMGEITSYELRASNTVWNFSPVIDINWQAQWGRSCETFGEDPYLTTLMGNAFIHGAQGNDPGDPFKTLACIKHLIGYGSSLYGKDRKNTLIPERFLRYYYLPPFEEAIKKGARTVMVSSGLVNSIPCHVNTYLITDVLKGELGFTGVVVSDWGDMQFLSDFHKTASDYKEAVRQMVNAGVDICMVPYDASFAKYVVELVNEGKIPMSRVDDAVRRISRIKFESGLFERPNTHPSDYPKFGSEEFANESYKAASEGITLLKNNHILPLISGKKILITGVAAHSLNYLNGPWSRSWSGQDTNYNDHEKLTVFEALREINGRSVTIYTPGTSFDKDINTKEACRLARSVDYIIVCLGEIPVTERPSDIDELILPEAQRNLVKELRKSGKPIILVLLEGRTRIINDIVPLADGILMAYYPGNEGGRAIADILFGKVNPSGKLPYSYQKYAATPMPYIHTVTDRADDFGGYSDYDPQWPFGFGLSYTRFRYDTLMVDRNSMKGADSLKVSITITNTGKRIGKEVVQLYLRDDYASVDPDFERLIRFQKVELQPGETRLLEFMVYKKDLTFVNAENNRVVEPGGFTLMTGDRNGCIKKAGFTWVE